MGKGAGCGRQRCWQTGSSILAFSHENPAGAARGCSSPRATPRCGLHSESFSWLPVSRAWFEYPRPTGFFGAFINSSSPFTMQTWAWRSRLPRLQRKEIRQSSRSVAAALQPAGMREEKHAHQFLNVSRDPLEIIYCVCRRL